MAASGTNKRGQLCVEEVEESFEVVNSSIEPTHELVSLENPGERRKKLT